MDDEEFFYGITLKGANATQKWDPTVPDDELPPRSQRLLIKNLLLGHDAKDNEYNVVEAQAPSANSEVVKIPIAVLKVGETRWMNPHLEFPDGPVTFKLVQGSGPVHMHGLLQMSEHEDELEEVELEEGADSEGEDEPEEENGGPKKKIKLSANNGKADGQKKK